MHDDSVSLHTQTHPQFCAHKPVIICIRHTSTENFKKKEETSASAARRFKDVEVLVSNAWSNVHQWQDAVLQRANQRFDSMHERISNAGLRVALVRSRTDGLREQIGTLQGEKDHLKKEVDTHKEDLERLSGMDACVASAEKTIRESEAEKEVLQRTILDLRSEVSSMEPGYFCGYFCGNEISKHFGIFPKLHGQRMRDLVMSLIQKKHLRLCSWRPFLSYHSLLV